MDSDSEDTEGHSNFSWVETGTVAKSEQVPMDAMVVLKDSKDSACGSSDESVVTSDVGSSLVKGSSSKDIATSALNSFESVTETGATAGLKSSSFVALSGDDLKPNPLVTVTSNAEKNVTINVDQLPSVNVPEKIILCFDLSEDQFYLSTKFNEVNNLSTLNVVKQAIEMFIQSKHMIDKRHEFAIVVVHKKAVWLQDFTNKPKDILPVLYELTETPSCNSYCLTSLFDVIKENVTLPVVENSAIVPPPYVIRPIIIYSRCQCIPKFSDGQESFHSLMSSKYFGFDYIVIHESLSSESDEIADVFSEMCTKPWSLKFHVSRSATKVLDSMAKLLSHPLQRDKIAEAKDVEEKYSIVDSNGLQ
ncbi:BRISC and BRCA1-A complex member 1-like [Hetaerina americana]|uniref:BRISC and BRCA1-A complex member 1-like n=1 Tax=Hetaerina americana TaxID=62018 RepID=UPI003A7F5F4F